MPNQGDRILQQGYSDASWYLRDRSAWETGVRSVASNPNIYDPGGSGNYMYTGVPYDYRRRKRQYTSAEPSQWNVPSDWVVRATDHNKLANDTKSVGYRVNAMTGYATYFENTPIVSQFDNITASHLQTINNVITNITNILNIYNGWFDGNDVCQLSCQTNCQVGCQVSCQTCVTSICHDVNCGSS